MVRCKFEAEREPEKSEKYGLALRKHRLGSPFDNASINPRASRPGRLGDAVASYDSGYRKIPEQCASSTRGALYRAAESAFFVLLAHLHRQVTLVAEFFDLVQLSFQKIYVFFFVLQQFHQ